MDSPNSLLGLDFEEMVGLLRFSGFSRKNLKQEGSVLILVLKFPNCSQFHLFLCFILSFYSSLLSLPLLVTKTWRDSSGLGFVRAESDFCVVVTSGTEPCAGGLAASSPLESRGSVRWGTR